MHKQHLGSWKFDFAIVTFIYAEEIWESGEEMAGQWLGGEEGVVFTE